MSRSPVRSLPARAAPPLLHATRVASRLAGIFGVAAILALSCGSSSAASGPPACPQATVSRALYPWLPAELPPVGTLEGCFLPPPGFRRVAATGFGAWLRTLPVRLSDAAVHTYRGTRIAAPAAAVVPLDLGKGDVEQCADSLLRLHAEYLFAKGMSGNASYHFTSGDRSSYADWLKGERFLVSGSRVRRLHGKARKEGHASYRNWLQHLFLYAGTLSLPLDSVPVKGRIEPGDFFVAGGSPGHAVIVLDVAEAEDGRPVSLIGEGYTPAQEFHVIQGDQGPWFSLPEKDDETLVVPTWSPFSRSQARRFR